MPLMKLCVGFWPCSSAVLCAAVLSDRKAVCGLCRVTSSVQPHGSSIAKHKYNELALWWKLSGCLLDEVKMQGARLTWIGDARGLPGSYVFEFRAAAVIYCPSAFSGMGDFFVSLLRHRFSVRCVLWLLAQMIRCAAQIKAMALTS